MKRFIPYVHRAQPLNRFKNGSNLSENKIEFADNLDMKIPFFFSKPGSAAKVIFKWVYELDVP